METEAISTKEMNILNENLRYMIRLDREKLPKAFSDTKLAPNMLSLCLFDWKSVSSNYIKCFTGESQHHKWCNSDVNFTADFHIKVW